MKTPQCHCKMLPRTANVWWCNLHKSAPEMFDQMTEMVRELKDIDAEELTEFETKHLNRMRKIIAKARGQEVK